MDMIDIEITTQVIDSRYGTMQSGAILRTDLLYAKHLVDDAACARYLAPPAADAAAAEAEAKAAATAAEATEIDAPTSAKKAE